MITTLESRPTATSATRSVAALSVAADKPRSSSLNLQRLLDGVPIPAVLLAADRRVLARNLAAGIVPDLLACVSLSYGCVMRFAGASTEPFEGVFARALNGTAASAVVTLR